MSEEHEDQEQVLFLEEGKKKRLKKEAEKAQKRGVRYISRVPPGMDHVKLCQLLNQDGEIQWIYLAPQYTISNTSFFRVYMFIFKNKGENGFSILLRNFCCVFTDSSSIDQVNDNNKSRKRGDGAKAKGYSEGYFSYIFFGVNNMNIYLNRVVYYVRKNLAFRSLCQDYNTQVPYRPV